VKSVLVLSFALLFCGSGMAHAASSADMISNYRRQNGEGRVTADPVLNRIAQAQARAMASGDVMDHNVLGSFSSRVASARAGHSA
jgi:uncharacterized protein YkwD